MQSSSLGKYAFWMALIVTALLLSVAVVYAQVNDVGLRFIKVQQEKVHLQMMNGEAGNPWQYRILADWMISFLIRFVTRLGLDRPEVSSFIAFRFLQCLLIFLTAGVYYRKVGLPLPANLLGLSILAWSMSSSLFNSDLSFNVFFDIAFYLIAALLILGKRWMWIPPLMVIAALNRETSGLIPVMLFGYVYFIEETSERRKAALYVLGSLVLFAAIFVGLRSYYGAQRFLTADGYYPGLGLLYQNLTRVVTWEQILLTFGIIPVLSLFASRRWPPALKIFFWTVVPVWLLVHFFASLVAETRLLLVPFALVLVPGALFGVMNTQPLVEPAKPPIQENTG